jgi:hypothetical protein
MNNKELITILRSLRQYGGVYELKPNVLSEIIKRLDPWIRIYPADPKTLPPNYNELLYCIVFPSGQTQAVTGYFDNGKWLLSDGRYLKEHYQATPYAYQPWPDPAPLPEKEIME